MKPSNFISACENNENINLTHFIISSDKNVLYEYCKLPYGMESPRLFFSMTKSITSLAIGIAADQGLIHLDDYVVDFFHDKLPGAPHENVFKIKVRHLLIMASGIDHNTYPELVLQSDWVKAFLAQDFPIEPGKQYLYSTHATHMLSAIITRVSGMSLEDFLNENLFYPMGITEAEWELSPEGLTAGGMGLSLTPNSIIKIAQLLLNNGVYNGRQLISQKYLSEATSTKINKPSTGNTEYEDTRYGYQFHIAKDNYYYLDGAFGQVILICPHKQLAFIAFSQKSKTNNLLGEIYKHFIYDELVQEPFFQPKYTHKTFAYIHLPDNTFRVEKNPLNVSTVRFTENRVIFTDENARENQLNYNFRTLSKGRASFIKDLQEHNQSYVTEVIEMSKDKLCLKVYWIETPYVTIYEFDFFDYGFIFRFDINVSFTLSRFEIKGEKL